MLYIAAYTLLLVLFLIANKRWGDRMEEFDKGMRQGLKSPRSRVFRDL